MTSEQHSSPDQSELIYSLRVQRRQIAGVLGETERLKFNSNYPEYKLIGKRAIAPTLGLVSHYETRDILAELDDVDFLFLPPSVALSRVMNPPAVNAKERLEFPLEAVQYTKVPHGQRYQNQYKIRVILDDEESILDAERAVYLENLARELGVEVPHGVYTPDITLGYVHPLVGELPSEEPLNELEKLLPDTVALGKIRPDIVYGEDYYTD